MRKFSFLGLLAVVGLFTACSSDDVATSESNKVAAEGDGYVSFSINLPTTPSTRAANDNFDDGEANEYGVYDATLILFEGTDEASATLSTAYNLNLNFNTQANNSNITSTAKVVQKLNDPLTDGNKFFALVVLNNNGQLAVDSKNVLTVNNTNVTGKTLASFIAGTKIDMSSHSIVNGNGTTATQFFMANAPLFTQAGGNNNPSAGKTQTLVAINEDNIKSTEAEAVQAPAAEVNVERAVAKVTLSVAGTETTGAKLEYRVLGWALNNTNTESYLVRNVASFGDWTALKSNSTLSGAASYRFVGSAAIPTTETGAATLYRTYWGTDPNYGTETSFADGQGMNYWDENTTNFDQNFVAVSQPAYCAENTFDVAHQKDINTTAAILKVQFKPTTGEWGDDFYTVNKDESQLYTRAEMINYIKRVFLGNKAIATALQAKMADNVQITADDINVTLGGDETVSSSEYVTTVQGLVGVKKITVAANKLKDATEDLNAEDLAVGSTNATAMVNSANTIRKYKNGVAYYSVLIKHFGDDLTPWSNGETEAPTVTDIYPSANAEANYLGRYGVLRNNWYSISVTSIKNLGTPTVPSLGTPSTKPGGGEPEPGGPDGPTDPKDPEAPDNGGEDDNMDQYLSVKINVLSWAKRVQSVIL
jgi:hypothetical protein